MNANPGFREENGLKGCTGWTDAGTGVEMSVLASSDQ